METTNEITKALQKHANKQLLRYAAGKYIFCPNCEKALNWNTIILIDVYKAGKHLGQKAGCKHCFKPENITALEKSNNITIEITKGYI